MDKENFPGRVAYRELYPIDLDQPFKSGLTGRAYMHAKQCRFDRGQIQQNQRL